MQEIISVLPVNGWGSTLLVILIILIFGTPAIFSEKTANEKFWLLGKLSQKLQDKKQKTLDEQATMVSRSQVDHLQRQIKGLRDQLASDSEYFSEAREHDKNLYKEEIASVREDLNAERKNRQRVEQKLDSELQMMSMYIAWVAEWARNAAMLASSKGVTLPPWKTYREWKEEHDSSQ